MVNANNCLYLAYFYVFLCKSHIREQIFMQKMKCWLNFIFQLSSWQNSYKHGFAHLTYRVGSNCYSH